MQFTLRLPGWIERFANAGAEPADSDAVRARKATCVLAVAGIALLAFVWTGTYLALDRPLSAAIPGGYQLMAPISLAIFFKTKRFGFFLNSQLGLMLILPVLLQWSLGGFVASSGVMLWAFVSPLAALVCAGPRQSLLWFTGFLGLAAVSGLLDDRLRANAVEIPDNLQIAFFVLNFTAVLATSYLMLLYFVRSREQARAALDVQHRLLRTERDRSERLLLNVLPPPIADRLKAGETPIADRLDEVTVLFADLVGFTQLALQLEPERLVELLNDLFSAFDEIAQRHGVEKIKTLGDGYLAAGGLPTPLPNHVQAVAETALAMLALTRDQEPHDGYRPVVRIGIDTGPVVAGVIGERKFSYDLWGDTVNTASRMATHAEPNGIQVTERVYRTLQDRYDFSRQVVDIKGKGPMAVYTLLGRRVAVPAAPVDVAAPS